MTSLCCPLCCVAQSPSDLEAHLREELAYPALRCLLCPLHFVSQEAGERHFRGPRSPHSGAAVQLLALAEDPAKEARLEELLRLAEGGQREVERRLCVCGECRLVCREDYGGASGGGARVQSYEAEGSVVRSYEAQRHVQSCEASPVEPETWEPSPMPDEPTAFLEETLRDDPTNQQRIPEASELENQPMDVKPSPEDLKPQLSSDGKVACILCGLRVGKDMFKKHAVGAHSTARPFSCNLCPHNEKVKSLLAKHQLKEHGTELSDETFTFAGSEEKMRDLVEQCFGAAKDVDWARLRCGPCDKLVNKMDLKNHIGQHHLKKVLHACKLCGLGSMLLSAGAMNTHVKKVHKGRPGPETVDSSAAQHYAPIIKNMIPQLFGGNK